MAEPINAERAEHQQKDVRTLGTLMFGGWYQKERSNQPKGKASEDPSVPKTLGRDRLSLMPRPISVYCRTPINPFFLRTNC